MRLLLCLALTINAAIAMKVPLGDVLPAKMRSNKQGTWAFDTMSRRVHENILPRIIEDNAEMLGQPSNALLAETFLLLNDLKSSLQCGKSGFLRPIVDAGPDQEEWNQILESVPESERNWLDAPWVISEFYFYRRVVEAFKFFESRYDPFVKDKVRGLIEALNSIEDITSKLPFLLDPTSTDKAEAIEIALHLSLWGNKMDLSLWPAAKGSSAEAAVQAAGSVSEAGKISYGAALAAGRPYILDDQTSEVVAHLKKAKGRIDVVVDNAGYELVSDFLMGYIFVELGIATEVVFHTKGHPTFVSDATTLDCMSTVNFLKDATDKEGNTHQHTAGFAAEIEEFISSGKFRFVEDLFWCQPTAFWDMPQHIQSRLSGSLLTLVKGDANYRRLLGEREWPLATPSADVLHYWHVPVCALRTFKAEIGCGVDAASEQRAVAADDNWMVSGKWGVVSCMLGPDV